MCVELGRRGAVVSGDPRETVFLFQRLSHLNYPRVTYYVIGFNIFDQKRYCYNNNNNKNVSLSSSPLSSSSSLLSNNQVAKSSVCSLYLTDFNIIQNIQWGMKNV